MFSGPWIIQWLGSIKPHINQIFPVFSSSLSSVMCNCDLENKGVMENTAFKNKEDKDSVDELVFRPS